MNCIRIIGIILLFIENIYVINSLTLNKISKTYRNNNELSMRIFGSALNAFSRGVKFFDSDKESNRKFRRTIFTKHDWRKHRSGGRYFAELMNMPRSVVLKGLTMQALGVTFISSIMVLYNVLIETKIFPSFLPLLTAPPLPFSLTSSALGLLLVFRTNAAYSRWKDARIAWAIISAKSFDVMRQSVSWIDNHEIASSIVRYLSAYCKSLKWQLGHQGNDRRLVDDLSGVLSSSELEDLMQARHRPQWLLYRISTLINKSGLAPNVQTHIDRSVCEISTSMTTCERIYTTPIPLMYTRHTARFLLLWLITVPMCLYEEFSLMKKWMVPLISFLHSIFLFGIEELGVCIEEPFSILPLANICSDIQKSGEDMLYDAKIPWLSDEIITSQENAIEYQIANKIMNKPYEFNNSTLPIMSSNNISMNGNINYEVVL